MRCRFSMTGWVLLVGLFLFPIPSYPKTSTLGNQKTLARTVDGFNVEAMQVLLKRGDTAVAQNKLSEARKFYDKARNASRQLLSFYRDLGGAFRGFDARVPREMDFKFRQALNMLAKSNLRLASLFQRQNQPEIAVPLLVEVVRLMTPTAPQGLKAYEALLELGFVETPYRSPK